MPVSGLKLAVACQSSLPVLRPFLLPISKPAVPEESIMCPSDPSLLMELRGWKHSGLGGQLVLGVDLTPPPPGEAWQVFATLIYNLMPVTSLQRVAGDRGQCPPQRGRPLAGSQREREGRGSNAIIYTLSVLLNPVQISPPF